MSKESKVSIAVQIVRDNPNKAPKDVISELETVLGMARRGASTYFYNAKKVIAQEARDAKNAKRRAQRAAKKTSPTNEKVEEVAAA